MNRTKRSGGAEFGGKVGRDRIDLGRAMGGQILLSSEFAAIPAVLLGAVQRVVSEPNHFLGIEQMPGRAGGNPEAAADGNRNPVGRGWAWLRFHGGFFR